MFRYSSELKKAGIELPSKLPANRLELIEIGLDLQELNNEDVMKIIEAKSYFEAERVLIGCRRRGGRSGLSFNNAKKKKERELCYE